MDALATDTVEVEAALDVASDRPLDAGSADVVAPDAIDAAGALDAPDAAAPSDAGTSVDAPDVSDAPDGVVAVDAPDVPDAADVPGVPDVAAVDRPLTCAATEALCSGRCVDLARDAANCGACGRVCAAGEACRAGACGCAQTVCGGACVNLDTDARNCGRCGNVCGPGGGCNSGHCTPCAYATASCNQACNDATCCFPCGQACTALEECSTTCRCARPNTR